MLCLVLLSGAASGSPTRCLAGAVERLQGTGNRRPPPRTRHSPATTQAARIDGSRPALPRRGESVSCSGPLAVVPDQARDIASVAPALGRETVDLHASGSTTDATRDSRPRAPARARQSAVGLSTDCWRIEGPGHPCLRDHGADLAEGRGPWAGGHASGDHLARVRAHTPAQPVGRRFLYGGDAVAATALRPLLHRVGQPSCASGRMYTASRRAVGHPTRSPTDMDVGVPARNPFAF